MILSRSSESKLKELEGVKKTALSDSMEKINAVRLQFITSMPGQSMIYNAKAEEALQFLSLNDPEASLLDFPMLAAEVGVTAPDAYQLAQLWLNMSVMWKGAAAKLERARMTLTNDLASASNALEVEAALGQLYATLYTEFGL